MEFRAYNSKGVDKNGAKCNMGFGRITKICLHHGPFRQDPWPRLIARSLPATLAPRPLLPALTSHGVRLAWPEAPHRPSRALQLLIPPRLPLGRPVRGVPEAPLMRGNAGGTSTAVVCAVTASTRCGVKFSVKAPGVVQCGPFVPSPRPTMNPQHLCADAFTAPALFARCSDVDELMVALSCRFRIGHFHRCPARPTIS